MSVLNEDKSFLFTVDYDQSLDGMVAACHLNWSTSDIDAKRFPIVGEGLVEFEARYFRFDRNISSENAVKEIESADTRNPWTPAKIEHMLSHGKTFPDEQRELPIVGLGSIAEIDGNLLVPFLDGNCHERNLYLIWWGGSSAVVNRSLAVRKVSGT